MVKFYDAGVGAGIGRARRWLPALENLPRTKPRVAGAGSLWGKQAGAGDVVGFRSWDGERLRGSGAGFSGRSRVDR
jgi:hypothetical protein